MRVLIIDDEEDIRAIAAMSLSSLGGLEVSLAENGSAGLQLAAEQTPDVILLDYRMPDMDGLDTLAALRQQPSTAGIPVIFLTASVSPSELEHLKEVGAHGAIAKPFDPMTLPDRLKELMNL